MEKKEKIERYIKGLSGEEERKEMESYFLSDNSDFRDSLEKDFLQFIDDPIDPNIDLNHILDKTYRRIGERELNKKQTGVHRIFQVYMKMTAILFLPLLLTGIFMYAKQSNLLLTGKNEISQTTIYSPLGSRTSFNLPDGTTGMLNSGSSISYYLPFTNDRKLELIGEGWFEVKSDTVHPLVINTLTSKVTVTGTSFNLSAYPEENYVELTLNKGAVEFMDKETQSKILLLPSERLVSRNGQISKSVTDTSKYNGWTEGKLIFRGDPMLEVIRRIMRWYNVDVELADKHLENYSFRGIFNDDKLEDILKFLAMTSPIEYEIIPREILPDGTFRKEKIIISAAE